VGGLEILWEREVGRRGTGSRLPDIANWRTFIFEGSERGFSDQMLELIF
jgi:hypothetical protein